MRRGDPAGAGIVLDHEILAEFLAEFFRDKTCRDVGDAARAERQDDANRTIRVCRLRVRAIGGKICGSERKGESREITQDCAF